MRIVPHNEFFVVVRGREKETYFSFFVDYDSSCWTSYKRSARQFKTENDAADCIVELRKRAAIRRKVKSEETANG